MLCSDFGPGDLRAWCGGLGEPTFVGTTGRVFPSSFRATPLLRAWIARLTHLGVRFELRDRWTGFARTAGDVPDPRTSWFERDGAVHGVRSEVTVLAMGGGSWPRVGSDGGWVPALRAAGVDVSDLRPSNCGIAVPWSDAFRDRFAGVPVKNVAVTVGDACVRGDLMITGGGLEAGPVYALSAAIRDTIAEAGTCPITVDLQPDLSTGEAARRLQTRGPKESRSHQLRRALRLGPAAVGMMREATGNSLPDTATALAELVKAVPFEIRATMPIARAISSAGGIALHEVDERFMLHGLPGTFVAGEMLDWEAPTGGYLLQATFSTAVSAARGALSWLEERTS